MQQLSRPTKTIFIDADDTLWENEQFFRDAEALFARLLAPHADPAAIQRMLWEKQEENIPLYGYGSKTYLIGMTDAAMDLCGGSLPADLYYGIKKIIQELAFHKVTVFEGVRETLEALSKRYRLILATKGDSIEQLSKVRQSGLEEYFFSCEVMKGKDEQDYIDLCTKYGVEPKDMVMVGNSVRSDIAPVVAIGGKAIFIPHEIVWVHEIAPMPQSENVTEIKSFAHLLDIL